MLTLSFDPVRWLLDLFPKWTTLSKIGRLPLVSYTSFIPVLGYLIVFNDKIVAIISTSQILSPIFSGEGVSDLARIKVIYIALCIIGATTIIFHLFSPSEVIRHPNKGDFIHSEIETSNREEVVIKRNKIANSWSFFASRDLRTMIEANKERRLKGGLSDLTANGAYSDTESTWSTWKDENKDLLISVFSTYFELRDQSLPLVRIGISFGYLIGFWLLIKPSYEIFIRIIETTTFSLF